MWTGHNSGTFLIFASLLPVKYLSVKFRVLEKITHLQCCFRSSKWHISWCFVKYYCFSTLKLSLKLFLFFVWQGKEILCTEINMKIFTYNSVLKSCSLAQKVIHTHVKAPIFFTKTLRGKQWRKLHKHGLMESQSPDFQRGVCLFRPYLAFKSIL